MKFHTFSRTEGHVVYRGSAQAVEPYVYRFFRSLTTTMAGTCPRKAGCAYQAEQDVAEKIT